MKPVWEEKYGYQLNTPDERVIFRLQIFNNKTGHVTSGKTGRTFRGPAWRAELLYRRLVGRDKEKEEE